MKNYYTINEISKLYNIGKDSLRYYEKLGILNPKREDNGYRLYSIQDIWKLNIIKDLRVLNFSMDKIQNYLENRTVENTIEMLKEEIKLLNQKIHELEFQKDIITERCQALKNDAVETNINNIEIKYLDARKAIKLNDSCSHNAEVDFLIKKLHKKYENKLYLLGNNYLGVTMDINAVLNNVFNTFTSVFFELGDKDTEYDFVIPSGKYIVLNYEGGYSSTKKFLPLMIDYAEKNGFSIVSDPIELYKIDVHETSKTEEYLTELQIYIK